MKKGFFTIATILCIISVFTTAAIYQTSTKHVAITLLNDSPQAFDDSFTVNEDMVLNTSVGTNDSISADGGNFWSLISGPANGIATIDSNGALQYTPNPEFSGNDTLTYQLCDIDGDCDTAFVYIVVNAVNDQPVTLADSATVLEDTPVAIDVISNDSDIDGNLDLSTLTVVNPALHGTTTVDILTGIITYTPNANYYGNDSFTYRIGDDGTPLPSATNTASVYITVTPVNDAGLPVTNNDYAYTNSYTPVTINVLYNDNFGDVPYAGAITATNGTHGSTSINNNNTPNNPVDDKVVYTPGSSYSGPDSFTYTISDIDGETSTATVYVDVTNMFAPTLTDPANSSNSKMPDVLLSWTAVPAGFHYKVQVCTDSLFNTVKTYTSNLSAVNADQLSFDTRYYWRVKAFNYSMTDSSGWSNINKFNVIKTVTITKPTNNIANRNVELYFEWSAITGITAYEYEIDTTLAFNSPLFVTGTVASNKTKAFTKELDFGNNYHMRMRAMHQSDTSDWSLIRNFSTIDSIGLHSPATASVNLSPVTFLQWQSVGSKHYEYALATDSLFSDVIYTVIDSAYNTIKVISPYDTLIRKAPDTLKFGQEYFWKARGVNSFGSSQWSDVWNFTTAATVELVAPANNAVNVDVMTIFEWVKITYIERYAMRLDTDSTFSNPVYFSYNGNYMPDDTIDNNPIIVHYADTMFNSLQQNTTYYWSMRALTSADTSSWSPAYKFTTKDLSGIDQVASIGNVSIYPNPSTNGHVNVAIPMTSDNTINLSVVNMVGQEIFADVLSLKAGNNLYTLNLRDKENGIYFVKLQSSDNTISRKIILNK